jgi:UDP-N-acetylmuramate dehydrogenase
MQVHHDFPLKPYNTFGIDAVARLFATFTSVAELEELLCNHTLPVLILGGGSNILFTRNFDGLVLQNALRGIRLVREDADYYYVQAGAGESWHGFVEYCLQHDYAGVENLSLIPGSVGASPMQNIGAYGVEIKDVFHSLEAYNVAHKTVETFSLHDCRFGYRESVFKNIYRNQFVILNVTFRLRKQPVFHIAYGAIEAELAAMQVQELSIRAVSQAVINIRRSKLPDPAVTGNAGSFFKNPQVPLEQYAQLQAQYPAIPGYPVNDRYTKLAAGWLIEQAGWKGYRKGDAGCHAKQALVLVNYGHATGKEIVDLSAEIQDSVKEKFGVELEREVNIV